MKARSVRSRRRRRPDAEPELLENAVEQFGIGGVGEGQQAGVSLQIAFQRGECPVARFVGGGNQWALAAGGLLGVHRVVGLVFLFEGCYEGVVFYYGILTAVAERDDALHECGQIFCAEA